MIEAAYGWAERLPWPPDHQAYAAATLYALWRVQVVALA